MGACEPCCGARDLRQRPSFRLAAMLVPEMAAVLDVKNRNQRPPVNAHPMKKKIVVIGTGYVGLPAALMWAKAGLKVVGVDINENVVRAINDGTMLLNER